LRLERVDRVEVEVEEGERERDVPPAGENAGPSVSVPLISDKIM
jgi:hypothetical protein